MTIINYTSDGLPPDLINLFRVIAFSKKIDTEKLISVCLPPIAVEDKMKKEKELLPRIRGSLSRWTAIGLFVESDGKVQLAEDFRVRRNESIDDLTDRLPHFCRRLILQKIHCMPLWEDAGMASDFVLGVSWLLAQDIYSLPRAWTDVERLQTRQTIGDKSISQNDVRWNGLRYWTQYLGFATGDSSSFLADPTSAIRSELHNVFGSSTELPAKTFLESISFKLPVLDFGAYRQEVEEVLNTETWRKPEAKHLSMSLSFALRRLELNRTIRLIGKADAGDSYRLTGRNYQTWGGFESVVWKGDKQ